MNLLTNSFEIAHRLQGKLVGWYARGAWFWRS